MGKPTCEEIICVSNYAQLGNSYSNIGQTARGAENTRKAYDLRER
jgi:hypothetical protein